MLVACSICINTRLFGYLWRVKPKYQENRFKRVKACK